MAAKSKTSKTPKEPEVEDTAPAALGDVAKDIISGFTGVVTGVFRYLNGCTRLLLEPQKLRDDKVIEPVTFDAEQVKILKRGAIATARVPAGGPRPNPPKIADPKRR